MKHLVPAIVLGLLACLPLYAAEEEGNARPGEVPAAQPAQTAQNDENTDEPAADEPARETDDTGLTEPPSDEDFVPTVRITEDLPVAFPVDI